MPDHITQAICPIALYNSNSIGPGSHDSNLLTNRKSKKANYGRFWAILGQFERIMNSKSKLASDSCYTE